MKKIHKATLALAGALLLGTGLFTACPHNTDSGTDTPPSKDDPEDPPITPGINLITKATASGWNTDSNAEPSFTGNLEDGFSVDFMESGYQWGAQFIIATDAYVNDGDVFKFTCKVNTSVDMAGITLKFDNEKQIYLENASLSTQANTDKIFTAIGKSDKDVEDITFILDFGNNPAATVKVSDLDFQVVDVDTITVNTIEINSNSDTISSGDTVNLSFTMNGQYPIDPEYSLTEDGVSGSTKAGNAITAGTVSGATGKITVTATYRGKSATKVITVTNEKDYGKYFTIDKASEHSEEAAKLNPGYMHLWFGEGAVVESVSATATGYSVSRTAVGSAWYGTQLFYAENAGSYNVSFKVKSSVEGNIRINAETKELQADEDLDISFTKDLSETNTLISIQLGVPESEILPAGVFTISDFSVTKAN